MRSKSGFHCCAPFSRPGQQEAAPGGSRSLHGGIYKTGFVLNALTSGNGTIGLGNFPECQDRVSRNQRMEAWTEERRGLVKEGG